MVEEAAEFWTRTVIAALLACEQERRFKNTLPHQQKC
jgi:hypothetical protein